MWMPCDFQPRVGELGEVLEGCKVANRLDVIQVGVQLSLPGGTGPVSIFGITIVAREFLVKLLINLAHRMLVHIALSLPTLPTTLEEGWYIHEGSANVCDVSVRAHSEEWITGGQRPVVDGTETARAIAPLEDDFGAPYEESRKI